jgi:hypothetical protein
LPDCWYLTLPVAVTLKRFFAPEWVFSLGILLSYQLWPPGNYILGPKFPKERQRSPRQP